MIPMTRDILQRRRATRFLIACASLAALAACARDKGAEAPATPEGGEPAGGDEFGHQVPVRLPGFGATGVDEAEHLGDLTRREGYVVGHQLGGGRGYHGRITRVLPVAVAMMSMQAREQANCVPSLSVR